MTFRTQIIKVRFEGKLLSRHLTVSGKEGRVTGGCAGGGYEGNILLKHTS